MDKIKAKRVGNQAFWILKYKKKKVGHCKEENNKFTANINNNVAVYTSFDEFKKSYDVIEMPHNIQKEIDNVHEYKTTGPTFNPVWNLHYKLPLFTKEEDSKSWYAAGYYIINENGADIIHHCPKLLTLQRNKYSGPFKEQPKTMFDRLYE